MKKAHEGKPDKNNRLEQKYGYRLHQKNCKQKNTTLLVPIDNARLHDRKEYLWE
jgi:hypothetical protein